MQGVFVDGLRCRTKRALREAVADDPARVALEATSMFADEYDGILAEAPGGAYTVVGPDPHFKRDWYATVRVSGDRVTVS